MITSPSGWIWNLLDDISILPSDPLTNCVDVSPTKNLSALISSILGLVLNLKKLELFATIQYLCYKY